MAFLKGKMLNKVLLSIPVELVLKINYPNGIHNMASRNLVVSPLW
jgi:hypothetical protein